MTNRIYLLLIWQTVTILKTTTLYYSIWVAYQQQTWKRNFGNAIWKIQKRLNICRLFSLGWGPDTAKYLGTCFSVKAKDPCKNVILDTLNGRCLRCAAAGRQYPKGLLWEHTSYTTILMLIVFKVQNTILLCFPQIYWPVKARCVFIYSFINITSCIVLETSQHLLSLVSFCNQLQK